MSGYTSCGSLHSGQTPERGMAEASSKKRIVTSVACEILAHAQECTSDCARMHRLELDEPNVRPWLKLCSVTRAACLAIAQERGTECEKRGLVPGGSCSQICRDSRLVWESAAGAEEARIARDLGIGAGEGTVEDHVGPGHLRSLKGRSRVRCHLLLLHQRHRR